MRAKLSLLFLQLDGDTSHRASLNPLHQMGNLSHYLAAEILAGNYYNLLKQMLVGMEVTAQVRNSF